MAKFTRMQITDLCMQLESDANTIVCTYPAASGHMKAAAMLLRLMTQLADVQEVETAAGRSGIPLIRRH